MLCIKPSRFSKTKPEGVPYIQSCTSVSACRCPQGLLCICSRQQCQRQSMCYVAQAPLLYGSKAGFWCSLLLTPAVISTMQCNPASHNLACNAWVWVRFEPTRTKILKHFVSFIDSVSQGIHTKTNEYLLQGKEYISAVLPWKRRDTTAWV